MLTQTTEWESETVRLVRLDGLPRHQQWPHGHKGRRGGRYVHIARRRIEAVVVHTSAGGFTDGEQAPLRIARFATANPRYKIGPNGQPAMQKTRLGERPVRIGGGRGWPGEPYTFVVPFHPDVVDGRFIVYRCWDDEWHTWHTSRHWNRRSVSVCFAGSFPSRHAPRFSTRAREPDESQLHAGISLITDYLLPRYNLTAAEGLVGHFDAGKAACPGDALEAWVRIERGEDQVAWMPGKKADKRPLDTWDQRQAALHELGFDPGPVDGLWGFLTRSAVEAFQEAHGLVVDGVWGLMTEGALRLSLGG